MPSRVRLRKKGARPATAAGIIAKAIARAWSPVGDEHVAQRDTLTAPWSSENTPDFDKIGPDATPRKVSMKIEMTAQEARKARVSVYTLLDEGTKVRHVRVTKDWTSKTAVRSTTSGAGSGDVVRNREGDPVIFFNEQPDGIDERFFDETINEELEPDLDAATIQGFGDGMEKLI